MNGNMIRDIKALLWSSKSGVAILRDDNSVSCYNHSKTGVYGYICKVYRS